MRWTSNPAQLCPSYEEEGWSLIPVLARVCGGHGSEVCMEKSLVVQDHSRALGKQPHPEQPALLAAALSLMCLIHVPARGTRGTAKEHGLGHNVLHHLVPNSTPSF